MNEQVHIYSGEHRAYWRPGAHGYTMNVEEAGVWGREEAEGIKRGCGPEKKIRLRPLPKCPRCKAQTVTVSRTVSTMPHGHEAEEVRHCPCGYRRRKVTSL